MTEVLKYPIPRGGQEIIFNIKNEQFRASKFLFAKFSNKFRDIKYLKLEEYTVKSDVSKTSFDSFLSACQGKPYFLTSDNIYHFYLLSKEFETPSIEKEVISYYENHDSESLIKAILINSNPDPKLIDSAASNFNKLINFESFLGIDPNNIKQILENPQIQLENHSSLFSFATKYQQECNKKGLDSSFLFQYIDLNQLSNEEIYDFSKLEKNSEILLSKNVLPLIKKYYEILHEQEEKMTKLNELALNISVKVDETSNKLKESNRLKQKLIKINEEYDNKYKNILEIQNRHTMLLVESIKYNILKSKQKPLEGVFYNFKQKLTSDNISDELEILLPSNEDPSFPAFNLINTSPNFLHLSYYLKVDDPSQNWITFHLKKHKISLYSFTIRTNELGPTIAHPKRFEILGSNDNENYTTLFFYEDNEGTLNKTGVTRYFNIFENRKIKEEELRFYSYIRYFQINGQAPYYDNDRIIALSAFEIFGILIPDT